MATNEASASLLDRKSTRYPVAVGATLSTVAGAQPVRVRNLSLTGAMIESSTPPRSGADVFLRYGPVEAFSRVVWCRGNSCGLEFDEPLSSAEMVEFIRNQGKSEAVQNRCRRPFLRGERLSADEWALGEELGVPALAVRYG